jgi:hypothetical protein
MVTCQSFLEGFCVIVAALDEGFSGYIIFHGDFGRMIGEMIRTSRGLMDETACNT